MIIDASNLILGRMASFVAKKALLGETIEIVNCEKAVITGNKKQILARFQQLNSMGGKTIVKGPFIPKQPHMFVKRAIKRMLPHKRQRGREALKKIRCYIGIPESLKDRKLETVPKANISKVPNLRYITVKKICFFIGGKNV